MNHELYQQVLSEYREKQRRNRETEEWRIEEISEKIPAAGEALAARRKLIFSAMSRIGSGSQQDQGESLHDKVEAMNRRIREELGKNGYPQDYLSPLYDCPLCRDTGFTGEIAQTPCACFLEAYARLSAEKDQRSGLTGSFEKFDETLFPDEVMPEYGVSQRAYMRVLRDRCLAYAESLPGGSKPHMFLHGGSGLGKTFLMQCIHAELRSKGIDSVCVTAGKLLNDLRNAYFHPENYPEVQYRDAEVLLLDDLGTEPLFENITIEMIGELINDRISRGAPTVISTNLTRVELKNRYTERFSSRILNPNTTIDLPFLGQDVRLQERNIEKQHS